jgi:soluble cytochrome b562
LKSKLCSAIKLSFLLSLVILISGCSGNRESRKTFVKDCIGIINEMKSRNEVLKLRGEAIIAYRKSGFMDVDNAITATSLSDEVIRLDSITLEHVKLIKKPDVVSAEILMSLSNGIMSSIKGNILFAANYRQAVNQNIEERKETILNIKPGMKYLAEGLNSVVNGLEKLDTFIKENNLEGEEEVATTLILFKMDRNKLAGFL